MVFTFEHVALDEVPGRGKWALQDLPLPVLKAQPRRLADRPRPTSAGTRSTGTTTTSRGPSRASATTPPSTGSPPPRPSATVLHLHRGTPYVYQGEELGMTNAGFTASSSTPTSSRSTGPARRWRAACREAEVLRVAGAQEPRQRPHPDALGRHRARRLHHRYAVAPGQPDRDVVNAAAAVADPDSVFHHYRRLIELRHRRPGRGRRALRAAAAGRPAGLGVHPHPRRRRPAGAGELLRRRRPRSTPATVPDLGARRCCCPPTARRTP